MEDRKTKGTPNVECFRAAIVVGFTDYGGAGDVGRSNDACMFEEIGSSPLNKSSLFNIKTVLICFKHGSVGSTFLDGTQM